MPRFAPVTGQVRVYRDGSQRRKIYWRGPRRPVMDWDDGFFFGDETTAYVHPGKAPEERLFFFSGEAVDFGGLD